MDSINENIIILISLGGVLLHLFLFIVIVFYFTGFKKKVIDLIGKNGMIYAFLISLGAMVGSLYLSEIVKFDPCTLCWYQRIFSYSTVFILFYALIKKDKNIIPYAIILNITGALIALYHISIEGKSSGDSVLCGIESIISCTQTYFVHFGYVTIPVLSLSVFVSIIILLRLQSKYDENH